MSGNEKIQTNFAPPPHTQREKVKKLATSNTSASDLFVAHSVRNDSFMRDNKYFRFTQTEFNNIIIHLLFHIFSIYPYTYFIYEV